MLNPTDKDNEILKICKVFWRVNDQVAPQYLEKYDVCDFLNVSQSKRDLDRLEELLNKNGWK